MRSSARMPNTNGSMAVNDDCDLQPLPEAAIVAAKLRQQADDLVQMAKRLEDSCGFVYRPKGRVAYRFGQKTATNNRGRNRNV